MNLARIYWIETRYEFLKLLRMPSYSVSTVMFPLMFYIFFGIAMPSAHAGSTTMPQYLLGTYGAFAVIGANLYALGIGIAVERGLGWLLVKRASPMPPAAYFAAKCAVALLFSAIVLALLLLLGVTAGGVRLEAKQVLWLIGMLLLGSVPFSAMGLVIGHLAGPNSAPAIVNVLFLPMSFCSGLWIPLPMLPQALQNMAPLFPAYHLGQIGLSAAGVPASETIAAHYAALAAFTVLFTGIAFLAQRREQERMYG